MKSYLKTILAYVMNRPKKGTCSRGFARRLSLYASLQTGPIMVLGLWYGTVHPSVWSLARTNIEGTVLLLPLDFQAEGVLSFPVSVHIVVAYVCPPVHLSFRPSICPSINVTMSDNASQIWAGITKFTPNVQGMLTAGIDNGDHRPWPSSSFCHFDSEF